MPACICAGMHVCLCVCMPACLPVHACLHVCVVYVPQIFCPQKCYQSVEEIDPESDEVRLHPVAKKVLGSFFLVYNFLLKDSMKYVDDYRVALIKQQVMKKSGHVS